MYCSMHFHYWRELKYPSLLVKHWSAWPVTHATPASMLIQHWFQPNGMELPRFLSSLSRCLCHFGEVSRQRKWNARLDFAAGQLDDCLPDRLYGVQVVNVWEDVLVPLWTGKLLLKQAPVQHVGRYELCVPDDGRAELERKQPGDIEVIDPEERDIVGDVVHRNRDVGRHQERAAAAVRWVVVVRPLFPTHLHTYQ